MGKRTYSCKYFKLAIGKFHLPSFFVLTLILVLIMLLTSMHLIKNVEVKLTFNSYFESGIRRPTKIEHVYMTNKSSSDEAVVNVQKPATQRPKWCNNCFTHNFTFIIKNDNICALYSNDEVIDLLLLINTVHSNFKSRTALRSTWLACSQNNTSNIRYVFLLGEIDNQALRIKAMKENERYRDIIKQDFVDTYNNLTYKTIMGLEWATHKCSNARYIMKTDDDMFINIPNLLTTIKRHASHMRSSIIGDCQGQVEPARDSKSKWFVSYDFYPDKYYPGFCSGTGYVMSMHIAQNISAISANVPYFHLEDVYIALSANALGLNFKTVPGFNNYLVHIDYCVYKGGKLITAHGFSPNMLIDMWNNKCALS